VQRAAERVRNVRAEMGVPPKERVTIEVPSDVPDPTAALLAHFAIADVARTAAAGTSPEDALAGVAVRAPQELLAARYRRDLERLRAEVERLESKLRNGQFVAKAAPGVVAKERTKLEGYRADFARTQAALAKLSVSS
jgi:valyl-tRNA synthetase